MYRNFFKRFIDVCVSLIAVIVLALPMAVIALLVKLEDGGPAVFKQERLGLGGKSFYIYKFRTMIVDAEKGGVYSDNKDPRVTKIGNILRKTSLDELPQFFNILKGDMSFVGPRPPLTYHPWPITEYTEEQFKMFSVRPGITGWAQVNGRKAVEWNKRIELNVWYTQNISLALDIKILFMTVFKVISNADNENIGATVTAKEKETVNVKE
ncbi:MAG: sugar transferase [Clostridia bacterium]|nr:sugar transferase [Clostridia bacterium]